MYCNNTVIIIRLHLIEFCFVVLVVKMYMKLRAETLLKLAALVNTGYLPFEESCYIPPSCCDIHSTERHLSGLPHHCNRAAKDSCPQHSGL